MVSFKSAILAATFGVLSVAAVDISVSSKGGNATGGHWYGFLHEDINNSGDGGIYAELIRNRAFQFSERYPVNMDAWHSINGAGLSLKKLSKPLSKALPYSINVAKANNTKAGPIGIFNDGYWGMDVKRQKYTGSFWVRGAYTGVFTATLQSGLTNDVFGSVKIASKAKANDWVEHAVELTPNKNAPNSNNTFAITFDPAGAKEGSLDFNLISLFPPTYKNRKNGLRRDIAEALAELHPTTLRFPGGNMLEGNNNRSFWDWKDTLGPLKDRPGFEGVWDYQQTHGLGLLEYLQWTEDMGLEPIVAVWAGLALNGDVTPQDKLQPFIDDALDQIEFIRGPATSKWGRRRAELGHPTPFQLRYVEVGNEDWLAGKEYGWETYKQYRFPMFMKAIRARYPDITVISSGASTDGFAPPEGAIGDYHPYREPDSLVQEFNRFDNDKGHIVGEIAATHPNGGTSWAGGLFVHPWWIGSVGEAVSLIGYERNGDRVPGTFYAPVLRNLNRWQWSVTILSFAADPALTTRSTSWYVWEMFAAHPITHTLPATANFGPLYYVAGRNEAKGNFIWKAAAYNTTNHADVPVSLAFDGVKPGARAVLRVLTNKAKDPYAYNDPYKPVNIVGSDTKIIKANGKGAFEFKMPELSVAVLDTDVGVNTKKRFSA